VATFLPGVVILTLVTEVSPLHRNLSRETADPVLPVLSFFTGAGFLDLGFADAGFDIVWHNEYDQAFREGFAHAMTFAPAEMRGSHSIESEDSIVSVGPVEIIRKAFGTRRQRGGFGVIGGPPCPDFSVGGKNRGERGDNGRLTEVFVDRIDELRPDFFVLENVPGLVRTRKHREFFDRVVGRLNRGYLFGWRVVNALDFGAPQDRRRLFVVGFRRDVLRNVHGVKVSRLDSGLWTLPLDSLATHRDALTAYRWPRGSDATGSPGSGVPSELTVAHAFSAHGGFLPAQLANGTEGFRPKSSKFAWIREGDDSKKSFKRLHRWRYSPAAAYGNNEVHIHPTEPRRITVREAMRLQTVPDWYALPREMTLTKKFKTVGNGVPVVLARSVGQLVREILNGSIKVAG
jgi:DNA (cytosine-5)-methyltransferase 1